MATDLERLIQEIRALPPDERHRLQAVLAEETPTESGEQKPVEEIADKQYQRRLVEAGLLKEIRPRKRDQRAFAIFEPVEISGTPLSETIFEERR
jgi:hypothetical protein